MKVSRRVFGNAFSVDETLEPLLPLRRVTWKVSETANSLGTLSSLPRLYTPTKDFYDSCSVIKT